jgi:hypothetical protein
MASSIYSSSAVDLSPITWQFAEKMTRPRQPSALLVAVVFEITATKYTALVVARGTFDVTSKSLL